MGGRRQLLVSDLDGTLLGASDALARFRAWWADAADHWRLVYATGRTIESVADLVRDGELPAPDAVVADVGTSVHAHGPAGWGGWPGWPTWAHDWPRDEVDELVRRSLGATLQEAHWQTPWKASFHAPALAPTALDTLRADLAAAGIPATVVYSSERDLDVMPEGAGKAAATRFLAEGWEVGEDEIVAAGDSGNDLELLTAGFRGIVVANAQPELQDLDGDRIYRASATYADGVLEGLAHWAGRTWPRAVSGAGPTPADR